MYLITAISDDDDIEVAMSKAQRLHALRAKHGYQPNTSIFLSCLEQAQKSLEAQENANAINVKAIPIEE